MRLQPLKNFLERIILLKSMREIYKLWLLQCLKLKTNSTTIAGRGFSNWKSKLQFKKYKRI